MASFSPYVASVRRAAERRVSAAVDRAISEMTRRVIAVALTDESVRELLHEIVKDSTATTLLALTSNITKETRS